MIKPISEYIHYTVCTVVKLAAPATVLDMGGTGKTKAYLPHSKVTSANITVGMDCTQLPYQDKLFDVAMSIATLEHVGDEEKQYAFITEALRVAKLGTIHWFPMGEAALRSEEVKKRFGFPHPCIIPMPTLLDRVKKLCECSVDPFVTCRSHLLMLAATFPARVQSKELYDAIDKFDDDDYYGVVLTTGGV